MWGHRINGTNRDFAGTLGVRRGLASPVLDVRRLVTWPSADHADVRGPVLQGPGDLVRGEGLRPEALVPVDRGCGEHALRGGVLKQAPNEVFADVGQPLPGPPLTSFA